MIPPKSLTGNLRQRRRLLIGLGVLLLLVLQLLTWQVWLSYQEQIREAETTTRNYATIFATRLDATLRRTDAVLQELARGIPVGRLTRQASERQSGELTSELDSHLLNFGEVIGLRVFDAHGDLLYSTDWANTPHINVVDRDYFRLLRDDPHAGLVFSEVLVSRATNRPSLIVARALRTAEGGFLGAVTAVLDLEQYQALFRAVDLGSTGSIVLRRSDDHRMVVRWPHLAEAVNKPLNPEHPARQRMNSGEQDGDAAVRRAVGRGIPHLQLPTPRTLSLLFHHRHQPRRRPCRLAHARAGGRFQRLPAARTVGRTPAADLAQRAA
jgi:hypothetical protein